MRTPRPGLRWTPQRQAARAAYRAYMASPAWRHRRTWWLAEHRRCTGVAARCAVCGTSVSLELHHQDYTRLGRETYNDLTALCGPHHRQLHEIYDASRVWRSLGRRAASTGIIAALASERQLPNTRARRSDGGRGSDRPPGRLSSTE